MLQALTAERPTRISPSVKAEARDFNAAAHGLRGIASLMVFFAHMLYGPTHHFYGHDPSYFENIRRLWIFGAYGVPLFFVISGFVILPSTLRYSASEFSKRRFLRLYPVFFASTIIFIVANYMANEYPKLQSLESIVAALLFLNLFVGTEQLAPNAWSLTFEVTFYVLTGAAVYFGATKRSRLGLAIVFLVSVVFLKIFPVSIFFVAGIAIRLLHDRYPVSDIRTSWILEAFFAGCCVYFASREFFAYTPDDFSKFTPYAIVTATACYFYLATMPSSLTGILLNRPSIIYIGTVSYSLYLVHPWTYRACRLAFAKLGIFTWPWAMSLCLFLLVVTPVTLIATHFVHRWLEVGPYQWFFRQKIYRS